MSLLPQDIQDVIKKIDRDGDGQFGPSTIDVQKIIDYAEEVTKEKNDLIDAILGLSKQVSILITAVAQHGQPAVKEHSPDCATRCRQQALHKHDCTCQ